MATKELRRGITGHANLGWTRSQIDDANSTTWNLAAEWALGHGVDVMGEVYGDDRAKPWLGGGLRWSASETLSVNSSYSVQSETPEVKQFTVGLKFAF